MTLGDWTALQKCCSFLGLELILYMIEYSIYIIVIVNLFLFFMELLLLILNFRFDD